MRYTHSLAEWIGKTRYFFGSLDPYYQLCDFCKHRRATETSQDRQGRLVDALMLCKPCFLDKQYQEHSQYVQSKSILHSRQAGGRTRPNKAISVLRKFIFWRKRERV